MRIETAGSTWTLLLALALVGGSAAAQARTLAAEGGGAGEVLAQGASDALERGFQDPPQEARPRVWWHWMNGNVTKEGIEADLRWMKRVGLGGVQSFDASLFTPVVVEKRLAFMTPEWKDAFRYAVILADQLGLEFAIAGSPGWSESGGPWVAPENAMKKVVWSETRVAGGKPFRGVLAPPPSNAGIFQNAPPLGTLAGTGRELAPFYADVAVVAFETPAADLPMPELDATFAMDGVPVNAAALTDGDFGTALEIPRAAAGGETTLDIDLGTAQSVHAFTVGVSNAGNSRARFMSTTDDGPRLLSSGDGKTFVPVIRVPRGRLPQYTASFPVVRARYFRVAFPTVLPTPLRADEETRALLASILGEGEQPTAHAVTELVLHTAPRVHRFEDKAGFAPTPGLGVLEGPPVAPGAAIAKDRLVDLTSRMRPDSTLDWTPPPGRWTVLRIGYSLTGSTNGPAMPEATGLEVDKLSGPAVRDYFTKYLDMYRDASGGLMGERGVRFVVTDSWEAGAQNWTPEMPAEFASRRGYDLRPWLPALAGYVVESAEASDRFLWDFRATIAELTVRNHYDQLTPLLRERGMGRYTESHEDRRALIADGMEVKRTADVPMSAMWTGRDGPLGVPPQFAADIRESASVAHIYGQNIVAAESLTALGNSFGFSPETLKATADAELSQGINRFVVHTSVHQPLSDQPGLGLAFFGQWFTRHETWAEQAGAWSTYLARSCYLLQQGRFVADVLYYYGDDSNVTALFGEKGPEVPPGYDFDYASTDVVMNRVAVSDGRLTTTTDMSYRLLVLDANTALMQLPVLRRIHELVRAGAVVVGPKPVRSPRLMDAPTEFARLANELWGDEKGTRIVGAGRVHAGMNAAEALAAEKIAPDFEHTKPQTDTALLFVHRALPDGDVYWVNNRRDRAETVDATFRVSGKAPEVWHPDSGLIAPASYRIESGRTTVPLQLEAQDAVFVVFRKTASAPTRRVPVPTTTSVATLDGPWTVAFQPDRGAPLTVTFPSLTSWHEHPDPGVKYFSGSATYAKPLDAPAGWFEPGTQLWLDLGDVRNLAEVAVNGQELPVVWKPPFRVDVSGALREGANTLEITIINLWVNRIIGDRQPSESRKYTYTSLPFYRASSPLLPSGLLGPVRLLRIDGAKDSG